MYFFVYLDVNLLISVDFLRYFVTIIYKIMKKNVKIEKKPVGRPSNDDPREAVPLRLRRSIRTRLKSLAEADRRSLSNMIEIAVEEYYAPHFKKLNMNT